ncbi:hypothetical protein JYU34_002015 [Plutella xylostella]|uniref:Tyrosine-protein phosphatase non-receptor type 13 n=1 Tax=Plutella xylostella TaxID=51655 RepID=A0ABQ7R5F4_PLUXY|nr:hypothetical protein JYU34_002015 [Plutella xylostella]
MLRNCDADSGRSSCSAASPPRSPRPPDPRVPDPRVSDTSHAVKRRHPTKQEASTNTDLRVSARPRSCITLLKSPDERDPFPSCRIPRNHRSSVFTVFDAPRKGGLSDAHSTLDIASSTHIEEPKIQNNAVSLNFVNGTVDKKGPPLTNFRRGKPVQRAASRLYRADGKGAKSGCTGPEFIVRASQPVKQLDLTLSALADKRLITVVLLNGQRVEVLCDTNTITAGQLFEAIVYSEKYEHNFMLGIAVLVGGDFVFLPDDYKLKKIAPENWYVKPKDKKHKTIDESVTFSLFLRIKFFLPTNIARNIQGGEWRHRVYLQLRRSTVEGQLTSTTQNLVLLAGYALHIEFGEFTYREHGSADYFLLEHYLPETSITGDMSEVKLKMKRAHESRRGLDKNNAIINYITLAQTFRDYGAHFYSAVWATRDGFCRDVWLSIGPRGVTLYSRNVHVSEEFGSNNNRIVLQSLPWHHIHTFYYNKKCLYIMPNANSGLSKMGVKYKLKMTDNKSYFAFWLASLHHRLYLKLYAKEDFINYLSDELSCPVNKDGSPKKVDCSNFQDSYNLAVRNAGRARKPVKRRFRVDIFSEKKAQNKENEKPNTEELLRQILSPQPDDTLPLDASPRSHTMGNSSNDGLSSSDCSLPRRHGVKMGTRVFGGAKTVLENKFPKSGSELRRFDDTVTAQSDSDDLCSGSEPRCRVDSMALLPARRYSPEAYVLGSPSEGPQLAYAAASNDSSASLFERLDRLGAVQAERAFVTASLRRGPARALGLQVAEGSDGNVYIKSITPAGPADKTNKLLPGDQIISVNGQTLINVKYDKALHMLQTAPNDVELIVLQNTTVKKLCDEFSTPSVSHVKSVSHSVASGLEDIEITDDELLNEEALKTIYALIKLTKEKVISRMKDKDYRRTPNKGLQKCHSENRVYEETDAVDYSREATPRGQKFHTWRGGGGVPARSRRPLSLSVAADTPFTDHFLHHGLPDDLMKKTSLKSIKSSLNSLDNKSVNSCGSAKNVALPRNYGLSRKWLGPVRYPVTPCKNGDPPDGAIKDVVKRHFVYGAGESENDQIFL